MEVRSGDVYEDCFDSGGGCGGDVGGGEDLYRCVYLCVRVWMLFSQGFHSPRIGRYR